MIHIKNAEDIKQQADNFFGEKVKNLNYYEYHTMISNPEIREAICKKV